MGRVTGLDFDAVFERHRDESRIPELFDKLIEALDAIVASGEVDSRRVLNALEYLIQSLKSTRRGSYFAIIATRSFAVGLARNWILGALEEVPLLGSLLNAFRETLDEMDVEVSKLQEEMQVAVRDAVNSRIEVLHYPNRALPSPDGPDEARPIATPRIEERPA